MSNTYAFISWTADKLGSITNRLAMTDNAQELKLLSQRIEHGNNVVKAWFEENGGEYLSVQGFEGFGKIPGVKLDLLPELHDKMQNSWGGSVSIGVGLDLNEAQKSCNMAQKRGGGKILFYTDELEDEKEEEKTGTSLSGLDKSELTKATPEDAPPSPVGQGTSQAVAQDAPNSPVTNAPAASQTSEAINYDQANLPEAPATGMDGAAERFHQMAHLTAAQDARAQGQSNAADTGNTAELEQLKQQIVQILLKVKQQAPVLEQIKAQAPDVYEAVLGSVQAMIAMAKQLMGGEQQEAEDQAHPEEDTKKSEDPLLSEVKYDMVAKIEKSDSDLSDSSTQKLKFALGTNKVRKIRDWFENHGITEISEKDLPINIAQALTKVGKNYGGTYSLDNISRWIDSRPKLEYPISTDEGTYDYIQRHSNQKQNVFRLHLTPQMRDALEKLGAMDAYNNMFEISKGSKHPVKPGTIGWVRWTGDKNGIHIDEVQSDYGRKWSSLIEEQTQDPSTREYLYQKLPDDKFHAINKTIFNGKHASEILLEAFHQWARENGFAGTPIHIWKPSSKAPLAGLDPERKIPGHINKTYGDVPEEKLGMEPGHYGELKTQNNGEHRGKETNKGVIHKAEELEKAIKDIKPAKTPRTVRASPWSTEKRWNYTHLLSPVHKRSGYTLNVQTDDHGNVYANLHKGGRPVGEVHGELDPDNDGIYIHYADLNKSHRGKGLGLKTYEAALAHAYHHHGTKKVLGGTHSSMAERAHLALSRVHGLGYKGAAMDEQTEDRLKEIAANKRLAAFNADPKTKNTKFGRRVRLYGPDAIDEFISPRDKKLRYGINTIDQLKPAPFDDAYGEYEYKLKSEIDQQQLDVGSADEAEEHGIPKTGKGKPVSGEDIARDHLNEDPNYYADKVKTELPPNKNPRSRIPGRLQKKPLEKKAMGPMPEKVARVTLPTGHGRQRRDIPAPPPGNKIPEIRGKGSVDILRVEGINQQGKPAIEHHQMQAGQALTQDRNAIEQGHRYPVSPRSPKAKLQIGGEPAGGGE